MKISNIKNFIIYGGAVGIVTFFLFFLITCTWIGHSVRTNCQNAQKRYEGTCTEALIQFLDDDSNPLVDRNSAIWSLGQLGEREALGILEKYYTGDIPDREPLDKTISQYELQKAIKLIKSGINLGAWVWR